MKKIIFLILIYGFSFVSVGVFAGVNKNLKWFEDKNNGCYYPICNQDTALHQNDFKKHALKNSSSELSAPTANNTYDNNRVLRVVNNCSYPIWIDYQGRVGGKSYRNQINLASRGLDSKNAIDFAIPSSQIIDGARATRLKAKAGCDQTGQNCTIGNDRNPFDTLFEIDWFTNTSGNTVPDFSAVDGYTFPIKIEYFQNKNGQKLTSDCGGLSFDYCPKLFNGVDQRLFSSDQKTILACKSNKWTNPYGCAGDDVKGCRNLYGGIDAAGNFEPREQGYIRDFKDFSPNYTKAEHETPDYVKYLFRFGNEYDKNLLSNTCRIYTFAYDDANGSLSSTNDSPIVVTFCPVLGNEPSIH
ncbi:hypothetical protein N9L02_00290 [Gammaproteobacteria bacterium]|nr:hypothetical protein [Gammaproteobacteria bacterium]